MSLSNSSAREKLYAAATTIPHAKLKSFVILNDKHSKTRTGGGELWHQAKLDEKQENVKRTSTEKVDRAKEIFYKEGNEKPYFVRKLNDKEMSQTLDRYESLSLKRPLYKLNNANLKSKYVYVEATEDEIEKNVKSFRPCRVKKSGLVQDHPIPSTGIIAEPCASMNNSSSHLDPTSQSSVTKDEFVQMFARNGKLTVNDEGKLLLSPELNRYISSLVVSTSVEMSTRRTKKRTQDDSTAYHNQSSTMFPDGPMKRLRTEETDPNVISQEIGEDQSARSNANLEFDDFHFSLDSERNLLDSFQFPPDVGSFSSRSDSSPLPDGILPRDSQINDELESTNLSPIDEIRVQHNDQMTCPSSPLETEP